LLPFKWIERAYGILGLFMLVFGAALVALHPPWHEIAGGLKPQVPTGMSQRHLLAYGYFAVALTSAVMFPYELYFYSSGAVEDGWSGADLGTNRITAFLGMGLGCPPGCFPATGKCVSLPPTSPAPAVSSACSGGRTISASPRWSRRSCAGSGPTIGPSPPNFHMPLVRGAIAPRTC
jgi:hypothetical protein